MSQIEQPWFEVQAVCHCFGVNFATAKNQISAGEFAVPTYKVGRKLVVDKEVFHKFFENKRAEGLRTLNTTFD